MPIKNIQIDERLHLEAKVEAARRQMTIKELTEKAIREYLRTLVDSKPPYEEVPTP